MLFKTLTVAAAALSGALAAPASHLAARQSASWTVTNLVLDCAEDGSSCRYTFGINQNDGSADIGCDITNTVPDAPHASWYDIVCSPEAANWRISWGYSAGGNPPFAVMTVVNRDTNTEAFFGYNNADQSGNYGNNGPQPTQPV